MWSIKEIEGVFVVGRFYQECMRLDSNGNLGIGVSKANWYSLGDQYTFKTREWAEVFLESCRRLDGDKYVIY
jgi:hypothetical protein